MYFPPDLVGASYSSLVLSGLFKDYSFKNGSGPMRPLQKSKTGAGSGCSGYLVQFGIVAFFDVGLAGADTGSEDFLSIDCDGDGL